MTADSQTLEQILAEKPDACEVAAAIQHATACSPFLMRILKSDLLIFNDLLTDIKVKCNIDERLKACSDASYSSEDALNAAVRTLRKQVIAYLITADLNGLIDMHEVVRLTSDLAEVTINAAVDFHYAELVKTYGVPRSADGEQQQMIVVGMGKLGGRELNVASDIDLIFAYEQAGDTDGENSISNQSFFIQLGKKLIASLDDHTEHSYVFRVDMLLRPFGSEGALIHHLDSIENYYQQHGREWERYAWIKGRVVAGPAQALHDALMPFVFRRYLDFNAYAALRHLKLQIQRDVMQRGLTDNVKLGRGGIREVEFIVQLFQLIRGGQDIDLQGRSTLGVLQTLADKGLMPSEEAQALRESYIYLRNVEHRLMYIEDQQTQSLPSSEAHKAYLVSMMRLDNWDAFMTQLDAHRDVVRDCFDATFKEMAPEGVESDVTQEAAVWLGTVEKKAAEACLTALGYDDASVSYDRLQRFHSSKRFERLPEKSQQRMHKLMPKLMTEAAKLPQADVTLLRLMNLLETICGRSSYLALLAEFPQALNLVVKLCASSPWMAQYLANHPVLLDELLNEEVLYAVPDYVALKNELEHKMQQLQGDIEAQMDAMRHFKHANILRVAAQDMIAKLPLEVISDHLSDLAQIILQVSLQTIWQDLSFKHIEQPKFAVIGYGKLGGKELGYVSDLDIIFLFDDDHADAGEIYAKFAQRINSWFNSLTNAGMLYETDLQLRPDGNSGLLVSSVKAFENYQLNKAWVWEHQAITRARFVAGDAAIGQAFDAIRERVMTQAREANELMPAVIEMRDKMRAKHPVNQDIFDVKQDAGGIIDVEFIVQYLVLQHAANAQALIENSGNIALLHTLAELGLANRTIAEAVANAYRQYRSIIHKTRLQEKEAKIAMDEIAECREPVLTLWKTVFNEKEI